MKQLPNTLIIVAAISVVAWVICRLTGIALPTGVGVKGVAQFTEILLLFAIAISLKEK